MGIQVFFQQMKQTIQEVPNYLDCVSKRVRHEELLQWINHQMVALYGWLATIQEPIVPLCKRSREIFFRTVLTNSSLRLVDNQKHLANDQLGTVELTESVSFICLSVFPANCP